jgi:hypothetical protein
MGRRAHTESHLAHRLKRLRSAPISRISLRTICAAPAHDYATWLAANLNKFSFCLGTHQFRRPGIISCKQRLRHAVNDDLGLEDI